MIFTPKGFLAISFGGFFKCANVTLLKKLTPRQQPLRAYMLKQKIATIHHIAQSVFANDNYHGLSIDKLSQVLSLALNGVIARACHLNEEGVSIDLGNGYVLKCNVEFAGN